MGYKFGTSDVDNVMIGTQQVDKIYMGSTLVWEHAIAPDHEWNFDTGVDGWSNCTWYNGGFTTGAVYSYGTLQSSTISGMSSGRVVLMFHPDFSGTGGVNSVSVSLGGNTVTVDVDYDTGWVELEFPGLTASGDSTSGVFVSYSASGDYNAPYFDDVKLYFD